VDFHELKRVQVRRHLAKGPAAGEVLVMDAAWMPATVVKKPAAQPKGAGLNRWQVVLIGSGIYAAGEAFEEVHAVTLPLHRRSLQRAVWPLAAPAAEGKTSSTQRLALGLNVLVAEDNRINARLACLLLDNLGCKTVVAVNGKEAVAAFQKEPFDFVLMDCQMPIMDGHAATQKIRQWENQRGKQQKRGGCKIIAMTASALPEERERCFASGMDEYLSKPFSAESLERLLVDFSRQPCAAEGSVGKTVPAAMADPLAPLTEQIGAVEARKLADIWLEEAPGRHQRLMAGLKRRQPEVARKEAHALRGASSIFGMRSLMDACTSVEMAIRNDKCVATGLLKEFSGHFKDSASSLQRSMTAG
jgi:CheY-like chemotaxis protein